jgi:hypothetical protein
MKPRSDSKLKGLPEDRQEQIVAWACTPKTEEHPGGLAYAQDQLAAGGLKVSQATLSEFVSWWRLQQRFSRAAARASQVADLIASRNPEFTPQQVRELAQSVFTMEALDSGDAETFVRLENLKLSQDSARTRAEIEREKLGISRQRLVLDKARQQLLRIAEQGLTDENKDGVQALLAEFEALGVK